MANFAIWFPLLVTESLGSGPGLLKKDKYALCISVIQHLFKVFKISCNIRTFNEFFKCRCFCRGDNILLSFSLDQSVTFIYMWRYLVPEMKYMVLSNCLFKK